MKPTLRTEPERDAPEAADVVSEDPSQICSERTKGRGEGSGEPPPPPPQPQDPNQIGPRSSGEGLGFAAVGKSLAMGMVMVSSENQTIPQRLTVASVAVRRVSTSKTIRTAPDPRARSRRATEGGDGGYEGRGQAAEGAYPGEVGLEQTPWGETLPTCGYFKK